MTLLSTYKIPLLKGYSTGSFYIEDTSENSPNYFDAQDFPLVVGGGRHVLKIKGGLNLRINTTVDIEIIDAEGQAIFTEVTGYTDRFNNYYISFDVYDITAQGIATAYFVGEALLDLNGLPVPKSEAGRYNVRWSKQLNILPFERNNAELIFDNPPSISTAQIVTPVKVAAQSTASAYNFTAFTSSVNDLSIVSSDFFGYDRDFASSKDILDPRLRAISVNPTGAPFTMNGVSTAARDRDEDVANGFLINYTTRFNTIIKSVSASFSKQLLGGYFTFFNSGSTPKVLLPTLPTGITVSGSVYEQLKDYRATIVEIVNNSQAILSEQLSIITQDANDISSNTYSTFNYKNASVFTGSIVYVPTDLTYITSSTVSQSYVEFTFGDLNPISGQVYRIKTSAKLGSITGDYKQLNDQIIVPVEYLTDAQFVNGMNYARHESDYRLVGHFVTQSILTDYWTFLEERPTSIYVKSGSLNNSVMIESAQIDALYTQSGIFTTQFNQNYAPNQTYTLGFYLTLDPYTEVEVYMNSDPMSLNAIMPMVYPRAFDKSYNNEKDRYNGSYNRFGKYLGKIKNDRANRKYYGKILYDFETDAAGLGRPLFRSRVIDQMSGVTGSAYVGEISIKPYQINGFTPNIVQYAVPLPQELVVASTLSQSIDFKIEYFDFTGRQSEYTTFLDDVILNLKADIASNTCQDDKLYFYYNSKFSGSANVPLFIG